MYVTPFGLFIITIIIEGSQRGVYAIAGIKLVFDSFSLFFGYSYFGALGDLVKLGPNAIKMHLGPQQRRADEPDRRKKGMQPRRSIKN